MKPFRFSLQSVRIIRERKEQTAQQHYARVLGEYEAATTALRLANEELAAGWGALCKQVALGASATDLRQSRSWCTALESRQMERAESVKKARYELDAASRDLLSATQCRQAIERLHDKHRDHHAREVQREEQKVLDEMGLRLNPNGELLRGWAPAT